MRLYCMYVYSMKLGRLRAVITALIGPSGFGKSTFLRTLNRINDLKDNVKIEGEVIFEGRNIYTNYDIIELRKKSVFYRPRDKRTEDYITGRFG